MNTLVVLFALCAVACGSVVPLAQPVHHAAVVLDPHGRPLDTAEVINARALHLQAKALDGHYAAVVPVAHSVVAPAVVAAPAAVSHQSRVDVHSSPAIVSHAIAAPVLAHSVYSAPLLGHSALGYAGHGHYLKKRSLGHLAYAAPVVAHVAPSAVSHQSRVDVISSPAVVSHAVAPVVSHAYAAPVVAHAAPVVAVAPAAVSHQSRVDVRTSPAVVSHAVAPLVAAAPVYASGYGAHGYAAYGAHSVYGAHAGLAHLLKKRSLAHIVAPVVHTVPSAVSHQSRVDVISKPAVVSTYVQAAPAVYAAPAAVYAAPAVSHFAPVAHSAIWTAPHHLSAAHW
uniref:SFRICE_041639 n=1 Tax=Spodoptera frugiperda TaxID=7108 RepID=A0A2H1WJX2_SPOFR